LLSDYTRDSNENASPENYSPPPGGIDITAPDKRERKKDPPKEDYHDLIEIQ